MRHLSTLSIPHYVYGGLIAFTGIIVGMIMFFAGGLMNSDLVQNGSDAPPELVGQLFQSLGGGISLMVILFGILVALSGRWIAQRRNKTGSMIIAGFCCLSFPFGTALGIFTFVTLANTDVQQAYREQSITV